MERQGCRVAVTLFNLGKGFSFATQTGAAQSGGDIKYEFEH